MNVADAIAIIYSGETLDNATYVGIDITDTPNSCSLVQSFIDKEFVTGLLIEPAAELSANGGPSPIGVGTYFVNASPSVPDSGQTLTAHALFYRHHGSCAADLAADATQGSVTITGLSASGVVGSYQFEFDAGTLSGTFNATSCRETDPFSPDAGRGGCVP